MTDVTVVPRTDYIIAECVTVIRALDNVIPTLERFRENTVSRGGCTRFYDEKIVYFRGMRAGYMRVIEWMRECGEADER